MASRAELIAQLRSRREAVIAEIASLGVTKAGGKPDVEGPGVNVKHQAYKKGLYEELDALDKQLAKLDGGFFESIER